MVTLEALVSLLAALEALDPSRWSTVKLASRPLLDRLLLSAFVLAMALLVAPETDSPPRQVVLDLLDQISHLVKSSLVSTDLVLGVEGV